MKPAASSSQLSPPRPSPRWRGGAWWVRIARPAAARLADVDALDPGARPQRPPAARLCDAGWPLAAAGDGERRRSALRRDAADLRGPALPRASRASIRWRWRARRLAIHRQRPHHLRRLDPDHAGGAAAGAARRAHARRQAPPDRPRHRDRAQPEQGRGARALSDACALWRQPRRHPRGVARLFRQGAEEAFAGGGGAAGGAAAIAGVAPAGSLGQRCARGARPRARPHRQGRD